MKKKFDKAKQGASRQMVKLNPGRRSRSRSPNAPGFDPNASTSTSTPSVDRHGYAEPRAPQTAISTTISIVHEFLAAARDGADLCLPLKAALVGAVKIFEICERTTEISDQYRQLGSRLAHLGAVTGALSTRNDLEPNLMQRLKGIAESLFHLTACIEAKQERGIVRRVLESQADVAEVKDLFLKITARIEAFIYESMVRVEIGVDAILARLPSAEERDLENEVARWNTITQVISSTLGNRRVHEAAHDMQPDDAGCMKNTRVAVLRKFIDWIKTDPKSIFWLAGMAGTGKTSISISLCRILQEDPDVLLGGTFFCSRTASDEARSDVRRIIPTLAALFSDQSPTFAAELAAELKPNSGAAVHKPTSQQIDALLQRPLAALASETRPIVFVIDALDECTSERETSALLKAIATFACPARVKFILTSRPETHILGSPISDRAQNELLRLHMIDLDEVTEDIRLYVNCTFDQHQLDGDPWYSDADVQTLARLSNGLFIFASTALAYILDTETPEDRAMRLHTALFSMKESKVATGPLDEIYEFVLTRASSETKVDPHELANTRQVLACILTARMPLSITAMAELLEQKPHVLRASLRRLRAVVNVPEELNQPGLSTLHASFGDYLFERAGSNLRIARSIGEDSLARGCLQTMASRLHFNVSQISTSYQPNLLQRPVSISLALEYSCLHWVDHVVALPDPSALEDLINRIFCPRVLFWLEVMSVLFQVRRATALLTTLAATIHSTSLSRFLLDANSFVASSQEAIECSAPHIYISALPFATKDSVLYQAFTPLCTGLISVDTHGIDNHAGRLVMTLTGHESAVNSVAYSAAGRFIGSGSDDGSVRVWDPRTGDEAMSPLRSGAEWVNCVSFSPDVSSIAAGTSAGVCIWSLLASSAALRNLSGYSGVVFSVVFSPDGSLLASTSMDSTLRIWNVKTGQPAMARSGRAKIMSVVAFSQNGQLVATSFEDNLIQLCSVDTGALVHHTLRGHTDIVRSLSFSPDGTILASGSFDTDIRIWNVRAGTSISRLRGHSKSCESVNFAPDGRSLVSASSDNSVRLWTLQHDNTLSSSIVIGHHDDWVKSTTFSCNGLYAGSASRDCSIRIWNAETGRSVSRPLACHDGAVRSAALSYDGVIAVSGSNDHSIRVWTTHTGEPSLPPLLGHLSSVLSVAISPDGHLIASSSQDCTIRLWDTRTGEEVGEPFQDHEDSVNMVTFSSGMRYLVSASEDMTVRIWDVATMYQLSYSPIRCDGAVLSVAFSPDSQLIAAGTEDGHIYFWYAENGQLLCEAPGASRGGIGSICFAPEGTHTEYKSQVVIHDLSMKQHVLVFDDRAVAFSSNGQLIASAFGMKTVRLWNAMTGALIATLHGHAEFVSSVSFTPDSNYLVSSSWDHTLRTWDLEKARSMSSKNGLSPVEALVSTKLVDGWLLGPAGELLLWVPAEYRTYICAPPYTSVIARYRVDISGDAEDMHAGEDWTSCWGNVAPTVGL